MERKENVISSLKDGLGRRVSNHIRPVKLVNAIFYDFIKTMITYPWVMEIGFGSLKTKD